ncbi:MAG: hypothetical protein R3F60_22330 [bacterium]
MKRFALIFVILIAGLSAVLYRKLQAEHARMEAPAGGGGTVEATRVDVAPRLGARIVAIHAREGEAVKAGQPSSSWTAPSRRPPRPRPGRGSPPPRPPPAPPPPGSARPRPCRPPPPPRPRPRRRASVARAPTAPAWMCAGRRRAAPLAASRRSKARAA